MPASASSSGMPAAMAEPNATSSRIMVGMADSSSARCSASSLLLLKSCHTAHSPVTFAVAPSGNGCCATWSITLPAEIGQVRVLRRREAHRDERGLPVG